MCIGTPPPIRSYVVRYLLRMQHEQPLLMHLIELLSLSPQTIYQYDRQPTQCEDTRLQG
ncbi:hypothetical protein M378DRAFT_173126 [Amanita muscaria Koide BX008]|uniref:Uncharacterized protein n=1 Tax=Amanita muscaria (strain Koide BX008) TaxID=946122 RepID=A0A0C2WII7_AMAMK|nr:hypothetical protein M378DRAFT_173126 [Amanita muscaria Koide BX008]